MVRTPERYADVARRRMRDLLLDAAYDGLVTAGAMPRMADIAVRAGVSRQTVYNEFGTRDGLRQALVLRQNDRFLDNIRRILDAYAGDLAAGLEAAIDSVLTEAAADPVTKAALTSTRGGEGDLLPFLTTRAEPLLVASTGMLADYVLGSAPDLDRDDVFTVAESLVRLAVSHIVLPLQPADVTARRLATLAARALRLPPPASPPTVTSAPKETP